MKKILIFEDDHQLAQHWRQELERLGHRVVCHVRVDQAIEDLQQEKFDIVITDVLIRLEDGVLSPQGGLTLLNRINLHVQPRPRVIVVSGADQELNLLKHAQALQADIVALKPVTPTQLAAFVEQEGPAGLSSR